MGGLVRLNIAAGRGGGKSTSDLPCSASGDRGERDLSPSCTVAVIKNDNIKNNDTHDNNNNNNNNNNRHVGVRVTIMAMQLSSFAERQPSPWAQLPWVLTCTG